MKINFYPIADWSVTGAIDVTGVVAAVVTVVIVAGDIVCDIVGVTVGVGVVVVTVTIGGNLNPAFCKTSSYDGGNSSSYLGGGGPL